MRKLTDNLSDNLSDLKTRTLSLSRKKPADMNTPTTTSPSNPEVETPGSPEIEDCGELVMALESVPSTSVKA